MRARERGSGIETPTLAAWVLHAPQGVSSTSPNGQSSADFGEHSFPRSKRARSAGEVGAKGIGPRLWARRRTGAKDKGEGARLRQ